MNSNSPENEYVADTVALILRLEQRSMGKKARQAFADVEQGKAHLHIPAMVFAEILYLAQRQRIVATLDDVHAYLRDNALCREAPLNFDIVTTAQTITDIPELHDRLIAATAAYLHAPLLTNDGVIRASIHVETVW